MSNGLARIVQSSMKSREWQEKAAAAAEGKNGDFAVTTNPATNGRRRDFAVTTDPGLGRLHIAGTPTADGGAAISLKVPAGKQQSMTLDRATVEGLRENSSTSFDTLAQKLGAVLTAMMSPTAGNVESAV